MKTRVSAVVSLLLAFGSHSAHTATLNWTNTASGVWNTATNWSPNAAPGPGDTAIITIPGVTVSLNSGTTVGGIILGTNGAGTVTLSLAGQTLVVNGPLTVNPSGSFTVDSGALSGNATISGVVNWTGGTFGIGNYGMMIAANGTVILAGTNGGTYTIAENVTNAGTLRMQGGDLSISFCGASGYGGLNNLPGALLDMAADGSISTPCGGPGFINGGTLRKSGGTGTNAIIAVPFISTGTVDAQVGTISLNGGSGSGLFAAEAGATLAFSSGTFTFTGNMTSSNAVLAGGTVSGNSTISGVLNWTSGTFGSGNNSLTIAPNALLVLAGINGGNYILSESVTNAGTVRVQSGNLQIDYCGGGQYGTFINLPGALVDMTADVSIGIDGCGPGLVNQGLVRKSGGTGTNNITGPFITTGTVEARTGAISLNGNDSGRGLFIAATGATVVFSTGTFALTGDMTSSNAMLAGATLLGNGTINGVLTWTSGTFGTGNGALTINTNAMLILAGTNGGNYVLSESVTNAGIIRVQSGNLQIDYCGGGQFGEFINLPRALVDMTGDVSIGHDGCGAGIINEGTVRKSGGTGTNNIAGVFVNTGTVDAQTGTISFNGTDSGGGLFAAETGATLAFTSGTFTLTGNMTSSNAVLAGATLSGNGTINGLLTWTSGIFGTGNNALTIATNTVLVLAGTNGGNYLIAQAVTNAGIVRVQSGNLQIDYCGGGQYGTFVNLPGALVNMTGDVGFLHDGCGPGIINQGTVRKSGGTGTNNITGVFVNTGTVDSQTGTISFNGTDSGGGVFAAEPGATLAFSSGTFTLIGDMTSSNAILAGATLSGNGTINGVMTWTSGIFGTGNNSLTIATNALLILAGTNGGNYLIAQAVTNAGTVRVQSGNLQIMYCGGGQYGTFINLPGALVDMRGDVGFGDDVCGPGIINMGTVRKSGGTGTNYIAGGFVNSGTIDVQNGSIGLQGAYTLANGTKMSFGLGGPAGNGSISLSGAASFAGSLSVNLNNSFVPVAGSFFNLLNYTSDSGVLFTNTVLPAGIIWQTNYYPTAFVLAVINTAQPTLLISTLNGTNLLLQWPADHTGWRLQAQTNPITVGLYTNWATVSGSGVTNKIFMPVDKNNGAVFFRLIDP
jgi:hypothetical protein